MNEILEAGNWKNKMKGPEAVDAWMRQMGEQMKSKEIVSHVAVFPPLVFIERVKRLIQELSLPVVLGAQDVSQFSSEDKPVTGEVTAEMLKAIGVEYVIIGHSERRMKLGETDEILAKKVELAKSQGLKIIYCVPNAETPVPSGVDIIAYEPPAAIGSGKPESPEEANVQAEKIKAATGVQVVLYGGSVTADNVQLYTRQAGIHGNLIGGASLKPEDFFALVINSTPRV